MPLETNLSASSQQRVSPFIQKQDSNKLSRQSGMSLSNYLPSLKISMFLLLVLQIVLVILILNPPNLLNQLNVVNIINEASKQANLPPTEVPVVAVIGDNKLLPSVDDIKKQNQFAAEVYKDAQNGDYVLAYSSKMVIFRASENKVIYEGDTPATQQTNLQKQASDAVISKAKEAGVVAQDSTETPGLSVVVDSDKVKATNSVFYANVQKDDIIATFSDAKVIVVYRPATKSIVNSGKFTTTVE